jgi:hypothetical protein
MDVQYTDYTMIQLNYDQTVHLLLEKGSVHSSGRSYPHHQSCVEIGIQSTVDYLA